MIQKKREDWELGEGEGRMWKDVRLLIPQYIPESRLDGCDIIDIHYELAFTVEIKSGNRYSEELSVNIPLTIGTRNRDISNKPSTTTWNLDGNYQMGKQNAEDNGSMGGDLDDKAANEFRHPLNHGDTRRNPLFETSND